MVDGEGGNSERFSNCGGGVINEPFLKQPKKRGW